MNQDMFIVGWFIADWVSCSFRERQSPKMIFVGWVVKRSLVFDYAPEAGGQPQN